jgi:hypothetical protein
MNLKDLETKPMANMSVEERAFISDAYLHYFDTLPPRERLLGYCVVYCGISALHVGALDIGFMAKQAGTAVYSLWLGVNELHVIEGTFEAILFDYLQTEPRIVKAMSDKTTLCPNTWIRMPLFAPKIHGKSARLHDCRTFLVRCGRAIGFNASRVILHRLRNSPYFANPLINFGNIFSFVTEKDEKENIVLPPKMD